MLNQSCPTFCNPMDCSPPRSSVHGISQARILEWVVLPSTWGYFQPRDWTCIPFIGRQILYHWTMAGGGGEKAGIIALFHLVAHTFISLSRVWTSSWQKVCKAWCWKKLLRVPWTGRISVYPRGNQLWIFIGRTDADAKAPILWLPDVKSQYLGKDPDAGKDWGQEEKWWQRMRRLNGITDSMDMSLSKLW